MLNKIRQGLAGHHPLKNLQIQKHASVLIPLLEADGELFVMLTQRSEQLRSHAGQVSFPGGKQHPQDVNPTETVLRETNKNRSASGKNRNNRQAGSNTFTSLLSGYTFCGSHSK